MAELTVKELKAYVPAMDFEVSKAFYRALGFELTEVWAGNFDCRLGPAVFRLQNYYVKDWANNFMLQFEVEDARAWFEHVKSVISSGKFGNARVAEPEIVGEDTLITHVWDPTGVLLIFIQ